MRRSLELRLLTATALLVVCSVTFESASVATAAPTKQPQVVVKKVPQLALAPAAVDGVVVTAQPTDETTTPVRNDVVDLLIRSYQDETNFEALSKALGYQNY